MIAANNSQKERKKIEKCVRRIYEKANVIIDLIIY